MATSPTQRQTLSLDLDSLFPGESLTIGNSTVVIRPLNIEQIASLAKQLKGIGTILTEAGITFENYTSGENMFKLAVILLDNCPDILEEASNIDINDLKKLMPGTIAEILEKIISVNLESKDTLIKNFQSLIEKFTEILPQPESKTKGKKNKK